MIKPIYVDPSTRIIPLPKWHFSDFQKEPDAKGNRWINFKKIDELFPSMFIGIFTEYHTGKTYGLANYVLRDLKEDLGIVNNNKENSYLTEEALLSILKSEDPNGYYDKWYYAGGKIYDGSSRTSINKGKVKSIATGIRTQGSVKLPRDFNCRHILYDEFNISANLDKKPFEDLDTIKYRWSASSTTGSMKHIWLFANKDGKENILATPLLYRLGCFTLYNLPEIFVIQKKGILQDGSVQWKDNLTVINKKTDQAARDKEITKWFANPTKYANEVSSYLNGNAAVLFNDDSKDWMLSKVDRELTEICDENTYYKNYLYLDKNTWLEMDWLQKGNEIADGKDIGIYVKLIPKSKLQKGIPRYSMKPKIDMEGVAPAPADVAIGILNCKAELLIWFDSVPAKALFYENS